MPHIDQWLCLRWREGGRKEEKREEGDKGKGLQVAFTVFIVSFLKPVRGTQVFAVLISIPICMLEIVHKSFFKKTIVNVEARNN